MGQQEAERTLKLLGESCTGLSAEPNAFVYIHLYQNIQSLYIQKRYALVCTLGNALIMALGR